MKKDHIDIIGEEKGQKVMQLEMVHKSLPNMQLYTLK